MRYLNGTSHYELTYDRKTNAKFEVFVDADFGGDPKTRRSTTGFIITYDTNIVNWKLNIQSKIARSTAEAEYVAVCDVSVEILFLAYLVNETVDRIIFSITVYEENSAAVVQCNKTSSRGRLKYLEQKTLETQELLDRQILKVVKISKTQQPADICTKPLNNDLFRKLIAILFPPRSLEMEK